METYSVKAKGGFYSRVEAIINYYNLRSLNALADRIARCLPYQVLHGYKMNREMRPHEATIMKLVEYFPEINPGWLMGSSDQMLKYEFGEELNTVARRIQYIRLSHNITFRKMARGIGLTTQEYGEVEAGVKEPSAATIKKVAIIGKVSPEWIKTGEGGSVVKLQTPATLDQEVEDFLRSVANMKDNEQEVNEGGLLERLDEQEEEIAQLKAAVEALQQQMVGLAKAVILSRKINVPGQAK